MADPKKHTLWAIGRFEIKADGRDEPDGGEQGAEPTGERGVPEDVQRLIRDLMDAEKSPAAIESLAQMGEKSVPALLLCLRHPERRIKYGAIRALSKVGEPVLPKLAEQFPFSDRLAKLAIVHVARKIGPRVGGTVDLLILGLRDSESRVRRASARALSTFGSKASKAVPALEALLNDTDGSVRANARSALTTIGGEAGIDK